MRIARYSHEGLVRYGVVEGSEILELPGHPFAVPGESLTTTGTVHDLDAVRLLAPVIPTKIVGIGKNYADHAAEMGGDPPERAADVPEADHSADRARTTRSCCRRSPPRCTTRPSWPS